MNKNLLIISLIQQIKFFIIFKIKNHLTLMISFIPNINKEINLRNNMILILRLIVTMIMVKYLINIKLNRSITVY